MVVVTWKRRLVFLIGRPVVPAIGVGLTPNQSTAQPTPKRCAQPVCDSQFHVPLTLTTMEPVRTLMEPSGFVATVPLMTPVPCESLFGLAAFATAEPTMSANTPTTVAMTAAV